MKVNTFSFVTLSLVSVLLNAPSTSVWADSPVGIALALPSDQGHTQPHIAQAAGIYRGTLGQKRIQLTLRPKPASTDSLAGEYFIFGEGQIIQLVAEIEPDGQAYLFWAEESRNGSDVSGEWQGTWVLKKASSKGSITGLWKDETEQQIQSFALEKVMVERKRQDVDIPRKAAAQNKLSTK